MEQSVELYLGPRDNRFKDMIKNILKLGKLKDKYIDLLTDKESLKIYDIAFTHPTANPDNNYEFYEILGDSTVNKSIVWYLPRRFQKLAQPKGVAIIARLKISLVSKKSLASMAEGLDMWKFVSCDADTRETKMKKTLEDIFESFIGATEQLIDDRIRRGAGYEICYSIIEKLLNNIDISLKYEDLFDAKTRLKEIFDHNTRAGIGKIEYTSERQGNLSNVEVFRVVGNQRIRLGAGKAALKPDAEQVASQIAIKTLNKMGFTKPIPEIYSKFN